MKRIGLTGGIGTGKSTTTAVFRRLGVPVFDADAAVHVLQGKGGAAVAPIEAAFPGATRDGAVDRAVLRQRVLGNPAALKELEAIVHPLVRRAEARFVAVARKRGKRMVVFDIPLLLEGGRQNDMDAVIVLNVPPSLQAQRVLRRPGMTGERLSAIRARQMRDAERKKHADLWLRNGLSRHYLQARVRRFLSELEA